MASDQLDAIIANGARTAFSPNDIANQIAGIGTSYWKGLDEAAKNRTRDAFKEGVPTDSAGNPDYAAMAKTLYQTGALGDGNTLSNLDMQRQQLKLGQDVSQRLGNVEGGGNGVPLNVPVLPPSSSRQPGTPVAAPLGQGSRGPSTPTIPGQPPATFSGGDNGKNTLVSVINAQGIPDDKAGPAIVSLSRQLGVDPNAPLDLNDPRIRNVLVPGLQMMKKQLGIPDQGQQPQVMAQAPQQQAPQDQPQPQVQPQMQGQPIAAPPQDTRGSLPTGIDPTIQQRAAQYTQIMSNPALPQPVRDAAKLRLEALQKNSEMTPLQKEYAQAQGQGYKGSLQQWQVEKPNNELTPGQKDATASGVTGGPLGLDTLKEAYKQDADAFQKQYTGIQTAGQNAITGMQKAQLLKNATLDPNFYSGPLSDYVKTYRQFQSVFGSNPGTAAPAELFTKVANDMLQEQIKSMGQSGVGRVLQAEVNIMKQSIATLGNTALSNRALAEIVSRTYQHAQEIADITRGVPKVPGKMTDTLNQAAGDYLKSHPMFTPQELQHPQILGAPDAPPQSAQWSPQQKQQWAKSVGLKSGDPIRFNGQVVSVP